MATNPTVLVFVHGGVHAGGCWDDTIAAIARTTPGLDAFAVDMPGRRGIPGDLAALTIEACISSLCGQIVARTGADAMHRVVLIGHSLAGVIIPGLACRLGAVVDQVIFVACCVPPQGKCVIDTLQFPLNRIARWVIQRAQVISRIPPGVVRYFFANGATPAQRGEIRAGLCAESSAMLIEIPRDTLPSTVRTSWVLPTRDRALRPATQRKFIRGLGGADRVMAIDAGHEVMITHPEELAAAISELVLPQQYGAHGGDPLGQREESS